MKHLNTPPVFNTSFEEINSDEGIIKGVVIAQKGEVKGHGVWADDTFLNQIVEKGKEYKAGVKVRFGHPNMSSTALGTYLGRFKNYRISNGQAIADLYIDNSAKKSPNGNLYDYIFTMASENPDMFGASVVFKAGESEFKETDEKDSEGKTIQREYARISQLLGTDLVDEPAATNGLFETFSHEDIACQVTEFLDLHPEVWEIADKNPEVMESFMTKYNQYQQRKKQNTMGNIKEQFESLKTWMSEKIEKLANPENDNSEVTILDNEEVQKKLNEFQTALENAKDEENVKLTAEITKLTTDLAKAKGIETSTDPKNDPDPTGEAKNTIGKQFVAKLTSSARRQLSKNEKETN